MKLGQLYNAFVGVPTGHYNFNLQKSNNVKGGLRVAATSVSESKFAQAIGTNTSQKGVFSSFRNEQCNERPVDVSGSWFGTCPSNGYMRCDFVSTTRPRIVSASLFLVCRCD